MSIGRDVVHIDAVWRRQLRTAVRVVRTGWPVVVALLLGVAMLAALRSLAATSANFPAPPHGPGRDVRSALEAGIRHLAYTDRGEMARILDRFYQARDYTPLWTGTSGLTPEGRTLVRRLSGTERAGFQGNGSQLTEIAHLGHSAYPDQRAPQLDQIASLEWSLSQSFLRQADQLLHGRVPAANAQPGSFHDDASVDLGGVIADAANRGADTVLTELERAHEAETGLVEALKRYRAIQRAGGWPEVPESEVSLELGSRGAEVRPLRERLVVTGDLRVDTTRDRFDSDLFDSDLEAALRRFQFRHGLDEDGVLGKRTLAALNVPVEDRVRQIVVNLERRRTLPSSFGGDYVWVNVPEFRLYAYRRGSLAREMGVVVGKASTPTPLFSDRLEYVVFNPYWNVPESIAIGELLPHQLQDPTYLMRRQYEIVDPDEHPVSLDTLSAEAIRSGQLRIRRRPGSFNDLGRIKFMMPNEHNVYLHDTNAPHLFERADRAFSHGCVRLERPLELATYVFEGQLDEAAMVENFRNGPAVTVGLEQFVPVYVVYFTAFLRNDVVHFRDDIYHYDETLWTALEREESTALAARYARPLIASLEGLTE